MVSVRVFPPTGRSAKARHYVWTRSSDQAWAVVVAVATVVVVAVAVEVEGTAVVDGAGAAVVGGALDGAVVVDADVDVGI